MTSPVVVTGSYVFLRLLGYIRVSTDGQELAAQR